MERAFDGEIHYWRGPAPYHFVALPVAEAVTYGWGMVPVSVRIGDTTWRTSLFPKDAATCCPSGTPCAGRSRWSSATSSPCGSPSQASA